MDGMVRPTPRMGYDGGMGMNALNGSRPKMDSCNRDY